MPSTRFTPSQQQELNQQLTKGRELYQFLAPKKPRNWQDTVKATGEVLYDAVVEKIGKEMFVDGAVAAYRYVRPHTPAPSLPQHAPTPREQLADTPALERRLTRRGEVSDETAAAAIATQKALYRSVALRRSINHVRFNAGTFVDPAVETAEKTWLPAEPSDIAKQVKKAQALAGETPNAIAVLSAGPSVVRLGSDVGTSWHQDVTLPFTITCNNPTLTQLVALLWDSDTAPDNTQIICDTAIVLRRRGPNFQTAVADPVMALGKVDQAKRADGQVVDIDEQVMFGLFDGLLRHGSDGVGSEAKVNGHPLYKFLGDAQAYEFASTKGALAAFLNRRFRAPEFADLRMRLTLFEVAKLNYFENSDIQEATTEIMAGTIFGGVAEAGIDRVPDVNKEAKIDWLTYTLNVAFGGLCDFVDNYKGRLGAVTLGEASVDAATYAQQKRTARNAALLGTVYGAVANLAAQIPMATKRISPLWLMGGTALSIIGTSLAIPFQQQADRARKTATVVGLLQRRIMAVPPEVARRGLAELKVGLLPDVAPAVQLGQALMNPTADENHAVVIGDEQAEMAGRELYEVPMAPSTDVVPAGQLDQTLEAATADAEADFIPWQKSRAVVAWADQQAVRDMTMFTPSMSSAPGFFAAPLLSLLWGFNFIKPQQSREVLQPVIFGISPPAENLSTAVAASMYVGPRSLRALNRAARLAINTAALPEAAQGPSDAVRHAQATACLGPVLEGMIKAASTIGNVNFCRQKSLL